MSVNPISTGMLRELSDYGDSPLVRKLAFALTAAQEENERLVHDIERLSASLSAEVTENEKLREALDQIANMKPHHAGQTVNEYHMQRIARTALDDLPR